MTEHRIPRKALLGLAKERVQVLSYDGNGYFTVLRKGDERVMAPRSRLTFIK